MYGFDQTHLLDRVEIYGEAGPYAGARFRGSLATTEQFDITTITGRDAKYAAVAKLAKAATAFVAAKFTYPDIY